MRIAEILKVDQAAAWRLPAAAMQAEAGGGDFLSAVLALGPGRELAGGDAGSAPAPAPAPAEMDMLPVPAAVATGRAVAPAFPPAPGITGAVADAGPADPSGVPIGLVAETWELPSAQPGREDAATAVSGRSRAETVEDGAGSGRTPDPAGMLPAWPATPAASDGQPAPGHQTPEWAPATEGGHPRHVARALPASAVDLAARGPGDLPGNRRVETDMPEPAAVSLPTAPWGEGIGPEMLVAGARGNRGPAEPAGREAGRIPFGTAPSSVAVNRASGASVGPSAPSALRVPERPGPAVPATGGGPEAVAPPGPPAVAGAAFADRPSAPVPVPFPSAQLSPETGSAGEMRPAGEGPPALSPADPGAEPAAPHSTRGVPAELAGSAPIRPSPGPRRPAEVGETAAFGPAANGPTDAADQPVAGGEYATPESPSPGPGLPAPPSDPASTGDGDPGARERAIAAADAIQTGLPRVPEPAPPSFHAPATERAPHPVQQVALAIFGTVDGTVEVALDPAELGAVRLALEPSDGAMVVHLAAERPDTLDLMRRHADLLARDLRDLGYADVSFRFGSGQSDTSGGGNPAAYRQSSPDSAPETAPTLRPDVWGAPASRRGGGALDLRL